MQRVVIGIVEHEGKYLMIKKRQSKIDWCFPGGGVEYGETEENAVVREVFEETSVNCRPIEKLGEKVFTPSNKLLSYWKCKFVNGSVKVNDVEEIDIATWMNTCEIAHHVTADIFNPVKNQIFEDK